MSFVQIRGLVILKKPPIGGAAALAAATSGGDSGMVGAGAERLSRRQERHVEYSDV
jgi:hypothetical protein